MTRLNNVQVNCCLACKVCLGPWIVRREKESKQAGVLQVHGKACGEELGVEEECTRLSQRVLSRRELTLCTADKVGDGNMCSRKDFCAEANKRIMAVVNEARSKQQHRNHIKCLSDNNSEQLFVPSDNGQAPKYTDTWIYPIIQMKPFEIRIDEQVTETLMTRAEADSKMCLTSGYFNLTQAYMNLILGTNADYQILLASPEVNGFFGAKGVAGAIPYAYVYIARQFCRRVHQSGLQDRIRLHEYFRKDWTFHAK
eukprot:g36246.t1